MIRLEPKKLLSTIALAAVLAALPAAARAAPRALTPALKDKLHTLVQQGKALNAIGARPQFGHRRASPAFGAAMTAAVQSGRSASDGIVSVPHFDTTVSSGGQGYPLMFVGSTPRSGGRTTAVKNTIVPIALTVPVYDIDFNFLGETTLDGTSKVANTLRSPIYSPARFAVPRAAGNTQWGDAMQRVTFFNSLRPDTDDWHVLLAAPTIAPTVNTADFFDAFAIDFGDGSPLWAFVAGEYIDGIIAAYLATSSFKADELPIFVTYNAMLFYGGTTDNCCVLGYHDAIVTGTRGTDLIVQTFVFADWNEPGIFREPIQDVHALSHEVAEWLNDPFIGNVVPPYANGEGTGCDTIMETGDQLVGNTVPVTINGFTYHPQTQDILQYFTRETPSSALGGAYIFPNDPNVPNAPAATCP